MATVKEDSVLVCATTSDTLAFKKNNKCKAKEKDQGVL